MRLTVLASACPKFDTEVALFHKLKMITRAVIWGQVETQSSVARAIITSIYLVACIVGKLSSSTEKTLKSGYKILTASLTEFEKQGFLRYLFSVHIDTNLS